MLAADFQLQGFEPADWLRCLELFSSYPSHGGAARRHGVVAVARRDQLLQLWRGQQGALSVEGLPWPIALQTLAENHDAPWAACLHPSALTELNERFASRVTPTDNLQDQWVRLMVALQELVNEEAIAIWPRYVFSWPALVAENLVRSAFELLCPPHRCLVLGVFDSGTLHTALMIQRGESDIERIVGPQQLANPMGLLSGDWLRDYPHLIRAVETEYCPVAGGCFTELTTLQRLLSSKVPGAWSQAVAVRDVVLHPLSPALAVSLGVDVGRAAIAGVQSLTRRLSLSPLVQHPALQRMKSAVRFEAGLEELLKLDPLAAIARMLQDRRDPLTLDAA